MRAPVVESALIALNMLRGASVIVQSLTLESRLRSIGLGLPLSNRDHGLDA